MMSQNVVQQLEPGQLYLLKWFSEKWNSGEIIKNITLKAKFIQYIDDTYYDDYEIYDLYDLPPSPILIGTLLTEQEKKIMYSFEHPLYPYNKFGFGCPLLGKNIGLFKITSLENNIYKGNKDPDYEKRISNGIMKNTHKIIYNETLMWIDLYSVKIRKVINKLKLLQEKALDTTFYKNLPNDVIEEIKKYL